VIKSADLEALLEQCMAAKPDKAPPNREEDLRALANIAQWREYLPADCVEAMIKDGWHRRL
jgi:hypothetical protein